MQCTFGGAAKRKVVLAFWKLPASLQELLHTLSTPDWQLFTNLEPAGDFFQVRYVRPDGYVSGIY